MTRMATRAARKGMTLLEVLVAVSILMMMMVAVWMSFSGTMRGLQRVKEVEEQSQIIRAGMSRITSEMSMAYLSFNRPPEETRHFTLFEGRDEFEQDNVTFSAFAHLRVRRDANESDQSVIQYFVAEDPEDAARTHLWRRESRRLTGDLPEDLERFFPAYVLIEDVEVFELQYWDYKQQEWLDEWRTTVTDAQPDRLPQRVKIKLGVKEGKELRYYHAQTVLFMQEKLDMSRG